MTDSMAAMMAAEMQEALGNGKRELISVSLSRREPLPHLSDLQRPTDDATNDASITSWRDITFFSVDEVTSQLQDRFNGLGHRARRDREQHERMTAGNEQLLNRVGEERYQYILERQARQQSSFQHQLSNVSRVHGSTPRYGGQDTSSDNPPDPNRQCALSPSRHGKVKFGPNGQRIVIGGSSSDSIDSHTTQPTTMQPLPTIHTQVSSICNKTTVTLATPPTQVTKPMLRTITSGIPSNTTATSRVSLSPVTRSPGIVMTGEQTKAKVRWYVLNPGDECDNWLSRHPEHCALFQEARETLIRNAMKAARDPDAPFVRSWRQQNKDREWVVAASVVAKNMVENETDAEIEHYYNQKPEHREFLKAARKFFKPTLKCTPRIDSSAVFEKTPATSAAVIKGAKPDPPQQASARSNGISRYIDGSTPGYSNGLGNLFQMFFNDLKDASTDMLQNLMNDVCVPNETTSRQFKNPIELVLTAKDINTGEQLSSQSRTVAFKMMSSSLGYNAKDGNKSEGWYVEPESNLGGVVQANDGLWEEED
ncbi:Hypothetical protein R9X50_00116000 [Acrodontium crateriforme]|uniref:Uncharacterized protein n=1 Tax=Acrodontium crateriforme TaxID=150365 RepID=A0AAQ3LZR6_9PEZI|nr:Hypothetical protein R9X50_00116000 [Acrodontium crateriforme]